MEERKDQSPQELLNVDLDTIAAEGQQAHKKRKSMVITLTGVLVVVIAAVVIFAVTYLSPASKFARALDNGDIESATIIFQDNIGNSRFEEKAAEKLQKRLKSIKNDYVYDELTYEEARQETEALGELVDIQAAKKELSAILQSKKDFENAEGAEKKEDYYKAIELYNEVSAEDEKNYAVVNERVNDVKEKLVAQAIEQAANATSNGSYKKATAVLLKAVNAGYGTADIDAALEAAATDCVDNCGTKEDYYSAFDLLGDMKQAKEYPFIAELESRVITGASTAVVDEAKSLMSEGSYIEAYNVLTSAKGSFVTAEISAAKKEYAADVSQAYLLEAENLKKNQEYRAAYTMLKDADAELVTDELNAAKEDCRKLYMNSAAQEASTLAEQGKYMQAVSLLNQYESDVGDGALEGKNNEYKECLRRNE